ncbi:hypothetical protein [Streptomyces sp. NBC_01236]|uniref:hypothetical protein n=1 Tax=Streptomyces sp. NBC_01236 TaxID=2903789 RepID=UPI002E13EAC2|nr:hypothetical protein OG324_01875 [Streptomyces sp. NBC_01236]
MDKPWAPRGAIDLEGQRQAADRCHRCLRRLRCGGRTERTQTAIHDGASLVGGLAGAGNGDEIGAEVGFGGGPVGAVVGGVVGGVLSGVVGSGIGEGTLWTGSRICCR